MAILSEPSHALLAANPWQRLAEEWPAVQVLEDDLGSPHIHGMTRWKRAEPVAVVLHKDLTQVQRRCALAHELEHLDRGAPCEALRAASERRVVTATARYLLPDLSLIADMLEAYDIRRAASELWVTFPVMVDRVRAFTDSELEFITARRGEDVA